ncbi:MAG: HAD family hydrolase [Desulfovibrio sp.]|nr:HAD family hydrolase [Desulfovibrio sp.]
MPLSCLVFDCDGVLLDSVPAKTHAFARLAEPYGKDAEERFVRFHMEHGGVNRFEKFAWFFQNVLGRSITDEESKTWGERFKQFCREELRTCSLIAGAEEVLRTFYGKMPLFVCSGAPTEEQTSVLTEHGLAQYFTAIYGAPPDKSSLLCQLLDRHGLSPKETLMVGDATTDRAAAEHAGTHFYAVGELLKGCGYPWGPDLTGLADYVLHWK